MGAKDQGVIAGRWMAIARTLCFIRNGGDVLLMRRGMHKRVFPGYYNGIGGHVERHEDARTGMLREIREETGLIVSDLQLRGVYNIDAGEDAGIIVFIFSAESASRQVIDCDEGTLEWVALDAVNSLRLTEDIPVLLSKLFGNDASVTPFFAHVGYDSSDHMIITFAQGE